MDVGRAISYVTQDPRWISKLVIAAAISLVPILNFALYGYALEITRRVYQGQTDALPEWDGLGDMLVRGLVVWAGLLLWSIPIYAVFLCGVIGGFSLDSSGTLGVISLCVFTPLLLALFALAMPVVYARYAVERTFGSMFEFGAVLSEMRAALGPLIVAALVAVLAFMAAMIGVLACFIGVYVTMAYAYLVLAHLYGQVYREARPPSASFAPPAPPVTAF